MTPAAAEVSRSPVLTGTLDVLGEILTAGADGRVAMPSAGAIHPYEVLVWHGDRLLRVDPAHRVCRLLPAGPPVPAPARRLLPAGDRSAAVLILTRPWLSMRKYGRRGHDYCRLDAAHLATGILGATLERRADATLHARIPAADLLAWLGPAGRFREIHSVVSMGRPEPRPGRRRWRVDREPGPRPPLGEPADGPSLVTELESLCWSRIPARPDDERPFLGTRPLVDVPGAVPAPLVDVPGAWTELSRRRRSSRSFASSPLPAGAVDRVVAAAGTALPTDLADGTGGVTVSVHHPGRTARRRIVNACLGQEHLGRAAAFVLFHVAASAPAPRGEQLLRAGAAAHLMYLAATAAGVAVTAVGGFQPGDWARLAGLPAGDDVIYLMALGTPGAVTAKWDRHSWTQGVDG